MSGEDLGILLKRYVATRNFTAFRTGHSWRRLRFAGARLHRADLTNANLEGADLRDAILLNCILDGACLTDAILMGADLTDSTLKGTRLRRAYFDSNTRWPVQFDPVDRGALRVPNENHSPQQKGELLIEYLRVNAPTRIDLADGVYLCDFTGAQMPDRMLSAALADLHGAKMDAIRCRGANLTKISAVDASLHKADLTRSVLTHGKLSTADLRCAILSGCDLRFCDLRAADLRGADLSDAMLEGACLDGAKLDGATLAKAKISPETYFKSKWSDRDLRGFMDRGVEAGDLSRYQIKWSNEEGLLFLFSSRLSKEQSWLVNILPTILNNRSDVSIVEMRDDNGKSTLRMTASRREDLEAVAETLCQRVWEMSAPEHNVEIGREPHQQPASRVVAILPPVGIQNSAQGDVQVIGADLTPILTRMQRLEEALNARYADVVDHLERVELRLPSKEAAADQTAAASARRELKLLRTWDPGTHPRTALDRLLAMLEPDELRLLLARGPEGAKVVALVPAGAVAPLVLASQAADELVRRELVDNAFFARLVAARPDLDVQVRRVAEMWSARGDRA